MQTRIKTSFTKFAVIVAFLVSPSVFAEIAVAPIQVPLNELTIEQQKTIQVAKQTLQQALGNADWQSVIDISTNILAIDPEDSFTLKERAHAYAELKQYTNAVEEYTKLTKIEPTNSNAWVGVCWNQILTGAFLQARPACEKAYKLDPLETANSVNLGHAYLLVGDTAQAEYWYQHTIPLIYDQETLNIGLIPDFNIFINNGWRVAESTAQQVWFKKVGEAWLRQGKILDRLVSQADKAEAAGEIGQAIDYRQQFLKLKKAFLTQHSLGTEHVSLAPSLNNLALLLKSSGRYTEAEPLFRRALAINEKALDPAHPYIARSLENLAELLSITDRYAESEPLFRRALAIYEKVLDPNHPKLTMTLNNLAELLRETGHYAEAEPLYRHALAINEKALGPVHIDLAMSLNNLAIFLNATGRYAESEPLLRRALAIYEKVLGSEHSYTATSVNNLASLLEITGRYSEAEPLYRRAVAIREKVLGPAHASTAISLNNLVALLITTGRYAEAEQQLRRALAILEKNLGAEHPRVATLLINHAILIGKLGRYAEAEPLNRRALAITEKALGLYHPDIAVSLNNLASLLERSDRHAEAEPLLLRGYRISLKAGDKKLSWVLPHNLSTFYEETHPDLAIFYGKHAVNVLQNIRQDLQASDKAIQVSFL